MASEGDLRSCQVRIFFVLICSRAHRSSPAPYPTHVRPGVYASPNVTFAPNVTPVTYNEQDELLDENALAEAPEGALFPPSQSPPPPPETKRRTGGKRRSQSHIPRPPNAFMLFRADFVRQKHVPGSIETSHVSLSKIIGQCCCLLCVEPASDGDRVRRQCMARAST